MKKLLFVFWPLLVAACVPLGEGDAPDNCVAIGEVVEVAPVLLTKEGFPIIDDQAAIPAPCLPDVGPEPKPNPQPDPNPTPDPQPNPDPQPEPEPEPEKHKCNSGRGNGSEGSPDCDPGNSGGHNQGGD